MYQESQRAHAGHTPVPPLQCGDTTWWHDFLLNVMMLIEIGHCRDVHDFILCHECGYINHLSDGLLNVLFLMDYLGRKNNLFLS